MATLSELLISDMKGAKGGSEMGTADEWCYFLNQRVPAVTCPAPEDFGFIGADRFQPVDYRTWSSRLLLAQQIDGLEGGVRVNGNGGSTIPTGTTTRPPAPAGTSGLLGGMTDTQKKWLKYGAIAVIVWLVLR